MAELSPVRRRSKEEEKEEEEEIEGGKDDLERRFKFLGKGLKRGEMNTKTSFIVQSFDPDGHTASIKGIECEIINPSGDHIQVHLLQASDGQLAFCYIPRVGGIFTIIISCYGELIYSSSSFVKWTSESYPAQDTFTKSMEFVHGSDDEEISVN